MIATRWRCCPRARETRITTWSTDPDTDGTGTHARRCGGQFRVTVLQPTLPGSRRHGREPGYAERRTMTREPDVGCQVAFANGSTVPAISDGLAAGGSDGHACLCFTVCRPYEQRHTGRGV